MKLSIWWPTYGNSIRMGGATSRIGGATSFPYPALPSRFKSLLNASGLQAVLWSHKVCLCTSPLQNLAVPQDFYSPFSISLERSGWPRIRWCEIGGFQEQVQCLFVGLVAIIFFLKLFSLSLLFLYRLVVWGWGLRTCRVSISLSPPCIANIFLIIIIIIHIYFKITGMINYLL